MSARKKPLKLSYCEWLGGDEKELAGYLKKQFPLWGRLPEEFYGNPYSAVASVALHPGVLAEEHFAPIHRAFNRCFSRYPDQVIDALIVARRRQVETEAARAKKREKDKSTARGVIVELLTTTPYLIKKAGKFLPFNGRPGRGEKIVEVSSMQAGEVAGSAALASRSRLMFRSLGSMASIAQANSLTNLSFWD